MFCIKGKAMSSIAMSNETDLDWLARNVHVWKSGYDLAVVQRGGGEIYVTWPSVCSSGITKKQWLTRRAELQNKPSWGSVGIEINFISQHEDGQWIGHSEKPKEGGECFECNCIVSLFCYGEVLGDWRDTLEKRPEQAEFEPFVSVEDAKITIMQSDGDVKNFGGIIGRSLPLKEDATTAKQPSITPSKYTKTIHGVSVDVYDVLMAWGVINPALQHLIKKALQCGQRGHKDNEQDLQDIIDSAIRAKELG